MTSNPLGRTDQQLIFKKKKRFYCNFSPFIKHVFFNWHSCKNHHESHMTNKESVALIIKQYQERKLEFILKKLLKNKSPPPPSLKMFLQKCSYFLNKTSAIYMCTLLQILHYYNKFSAIWKLHSYLIIIPWTFKQ